MLYRTLGLVAAFTRRLSLIRLNFIPLHLAAMVGLAALVTVGSKATRDAMVNDRAPRAVSIAEVLDHVDMAHNFVSVRGRLVATALFQRTTSRSGRQHIDSSYLPLLDVEGHRGLLVERPGNVFTYVDPKDVVVTGMLEPLQHDVRSELDKVGSKIEGVPFDRDYMLVENRSPGNALVLGAVTALAGLLLLAMIVTWRWKYVVFHGSPGTISPQAPVPPENGIDVFVSGRMHLDQHARHFVCMPAMVGCTEDGALIVEARIDASSRFLGIQTVQRRGIWHLELDAARVAEAEPGDQYLGWRRRPALLLATAEGPALLCCSDENERDHLFYELQRLAKPA